MSDGPRQPFKNMATIVSKVKLTGTDKQVKWAETIRKKRVKELEDGKPRTAFLALKAVLTEADLQEMRCVTAKNISSLCSGVIMHLLKQPAASFWIDTKDLPTHSLFAKCAQEKIAEYKDTKPFRHE